MINTKKDKTDFLTEDNLLNLIKNFGNGIIPTNDNPKYVNTSYSGTRIDKIEEEILSEFPNYNKDVDKTIVKNNQFVYYSFNVPFIKNIIFVVDVSI